MKKKTYPKLPHPNFINLKTGPNMELTGCKLKLKPDCCHFANLPLGSTDNSSRTEKYLKNTIFLLGFKVVPFIRSLFLQVHIGLGGISTDFRLGLKSLARIWWCPTIGNGSWGSPRQFPDILAILTILRIKIKSACVAHWRNFNADK